MILLPIFDPIVEHVAEGGSECGVWSVPDQADILIVDMWRCGVLLCNSCNVSIFRNNTIFTAL